ncbi:MAG: ExbD/TolR family protein [Saprospiraceae bacterium]
MASLTDVIFLLLIFFVLTSKIVRITPFELPESDSKTLAPVTVVVEIGENGRYKIGGKMMSKRQVETALRQRVKGVENPRDITVTIAAEKDQPFDYVVDVIEIAGKLKVKAILATQPKKS